MKYTSLLLLPLLLLATRATAQNIPASRLINWGKAGYNDSLPSYSTQVNIMSYGGKADGTSPNDTAFANALAALNNKPGTIFFPAGSYLFNQPIIIAQDSLVLKGEGSSTRLLFDLGNAETETIYFRGTVTIPAASIKSTLNKGDTSLIIHNGSNYHPGDIIQLWGNDSNVIFSPWALQSASQIIRLKNVVVDTLIFDQPLRRSYPSTYDGFIRVFDEVLACGVECMYIERKDTTSLQKSNICFERAAYCWVTGVESKDCNFAHITANYSTHITIRGNYLHHAHSYGEGGKGYGVVLEYTSGDCLVENNIFEHLRHSMLLQAGANGNVLAGNYSKDPYWTQPPLPTNSAGDIVLHGNYPYLNLFEGNIVQNIVIDDSHGINGPHNTFYRNRAETYGIFTNTNPATDSVTYVGNEVTNSALGYYLLNGNGHFEAGNKIKGTITPASTNLPTNITLYHPSFIPAYWPGNLVYPAIGIAGTAYPDNGAKARNKKGQNTDCRKNPEYISVQDIQQQGDDIMAYPNPFASGITLHTTDDRYTTYTLSNIYGSILASGNITGPNTAIDGAQLPAGIYLLTVYGQDGEKATLRLNKIQ